MRPCKHTPATAREECPICRIAARDPRRAARWDADYHAQMLPKPKPGLIRQALNFGHALIGHLAAGRPQSTDLEAAARQSICEGCTGPEGFYIAETDTCTHPSCGCKIRRKSRWKDQRCPLGKW